MSEKHSKENTTASSRGFHFQLHRLGMTDHFSMVLIAVVIGLLSGVGAIILRQSIHFFQTLFFGKSSPSLDYLFATPWYLKILIPAAGGLIVGIVIHYFASEVKGHGVPEVMEALVRRGGIIRLRTVFAKIVASAVCIGSGGSTGREGPIVQIGSAIGSAIGQFLKYSGARMQTLVGCGAAAGIAAAFNAPIAGALFALEVVLGDFAVAHFSPIVISSVTATIISRYYFGNTPAFEIPEYELVSAFEMLPYIILGILAGLTAILFIRLLYATEDIFEKSSIPQALRPAIGGMMIGVIAIWFPHVYGVGYETMDFALEGYFGGWLLLAIFFAKIMATSLTLGSGGSGGIFAPALFMGSMLGGFVGTFVHRAFPTMTAGHGAYALVGMGAMVAGTIHAPISSIIIIFEMTNDYSIILPLMVSCILATIISTRLQPLSIYTLKLARKGISLKQGRDVNIFKHLSVRDHMENDPKIVHREDKFDMIANLFLSEKTRTLFVTGSDNRLIGVIAFDHLRQTMPEWRDLTGILIAEDVLTESPGELTIEDTLDHAMRLFARIGNDELPVLNHQGELAGALSKSQAIEAYNRELLKQDLAFEMKEGLEEVSKSSHYRFTSDFILSSLPVPAPFVGKTMKELRVRSRFNVEIVLIKNSEGEEVFPDADYRLNATDLICVVGKKDLIDALKHL